MNLISQSLLDSLLDGVYLALLFSLALGVKSVLDFTRTGPELREEVMRHYRLYAAYCVARLLAWCFLITLALAEAGIAISLMLSNLFGTDYSMFQNLVLGLLFICWVTLLQFSAHLLHIPGSISASWQYRLDRLYPLWERLDPRRIQIAYRATGAVLAAATLTGLWLSYRNGQADLMLFYSILLVIGVSWLTHRLLRRYALRATTARRQDGPPNIIMIGSDTLRSDHLSCSGYHRNTSPNIDRLADGGWFFPNCYVPIARTAPSLASLFTGSWPNRHGIKTNFVADHETEITTDSLPSFLEQRGYRTLALSDWAGADLKKLTLGFRGHEVPDDQWNIRYYLRQGPMDLRLYISLFTHNELGRLLIPEIYYLAGTPLNRPLSDSARRAISRAARSESPFFLNLFMAATHAPFGSEYPFYLEYADSGYCGESKFVMTSFRDPNEIINKQSAPSSSFDVDQIINLYDGCVRNFDHAVGEIRQHLADCGLADNTIIVVYSDHGIDFFENESWGQGNTVKGQDYSGRTPFVLFDPRRPGAGLRREIIRSVDIAPTLVDLCELDGAFNCDGSSLAPAISGTEEFPNLTAYQETGIWVSDIRGMESNHIRYPNLLELLEIKNHSTGTLSIKDKYWPVILEAKDRMVAKGVWKLVSISLEDGKQYALYRTDEDPQCLQDVSDQYPEQLAIMTAELLALAGRD